MMSRPYARLRAHFRQQFVGYLALFVALGGSAYAAATIGPNDIKNNAVRSNHIKDGRVAKADLATNSVGTKKVTDGSLLKQDFKAGQLPRGQNAASMVMGATDLLALPPSSQDSAAVSGPDAGAALFERTAAATSIARDLYAKVKIPPPANSSLTIVLSVDGVDTALTCSIPAGGTSCQDTTHQVTIPGGSNLVWHASNPSSSSATTTATAASMSMRLLTP